MCGGREARLLESLMRIGDRLMSCLGKGNKESSERDSEMLVGG